MNKKALHKKYNFIVITILLCSKIALSQTWVQPCVDDAFIRTSATCPTWQTTNYGTATYFDVAYWTYGGSGCSGPGTKRSLVKFNINSPTNNPQQLYDGRASLNLHTNPGSTNWWQGAGTTGNPYYIKIVTSAWMETSVTWNTQPTTTNVGQITVPSSTLNSTASSINDVSSIVNDWACGVYPNNGFALQLVNETQLYAQWTFVSKEHATSSLHPTLSMEYATIAASAIDTICDGDLIPALTCSLTNATNLSDYTFQWQHLNSGTGYSTQNVVNPAYVPGLNTYVVTVTNTYCQTGKDTVHVYVNAIATTTQNQTICTGSSFTLPGGTTVTTAGTYVDTLVSSSGCDSVITTALTLNSIITSIQNQTICIGSSFTLPDGTIVTAAGTYVDTLITSSGCDSVITTTLTLNSIITSTQNPFICTGSTYTLPDGTTVTTAGTYVDTLISYSGCDSVITTTLTINPIITSNQNPVICTGSTFVLPGGTIVTTAGTYVDTLISSIGCDSVITTTLTINSIITSNQNPVICTGSTFVLPSGTSLTTGGTYVDTLISYSGCDSVITTVLTVNAVINNNQNPIICSGATYTLPDGSIVNSAGIYIDTLQSGSGCDSIVTTNLTLSPIRIGSQNPIICGGSFTLPNGNSVTTSGTYIDSITTLSGCDSVIVTNLIVHPTYSITQNINICSDSSYLLPGGTIANTSGNYYDTLVTTAGCDSIIVTNLTIVPKPVALFSVNPETASIIDDPTFVFTDNSVDGNTWQWDFGDGTTASIQNPTHVYADTGKYCIKQLVVNMPSGCKDSTEKCVYLSSDFVFYIPNAFTPNGDGLNDSFLGKGSGIKTIKMFIYDRWGNMVFYSNDINSGWDGRVNDGNAIAQQDIYVYVIYITDVKAKQHKYMGDITLVK